MHTQTFSVLFSCFGLSHIDCTYFPNACKAFSRIGFWTYLTTFFCDVVINPLLLAEKYGAGNIVGQALGGGSHGGHGGHGGSHGGDILKLDTNISSITK